MRIATLILVFILVVSCEEKEAANYTETIKKHQYELNLLYNDQTQSPLKPEDLKNFSKLDFFPIDSTYRVKAIFKPLTAGKVVSIPTNTERISLYLEYALLQFSLNGIQEELTVYKSQELGEGNYLFLPFTDPTNGIESYGAGRYIDLRFMEPIEQEIWLDFNLSYNPYCAYNEDFSCPIPPANNNLNNPINAGVKKYH